MKKLIATILVIAGMFISVAAMACPHCDCACGDDCKCKPCECQKK